MKEISLSQMSQTGTFDSLRKKPLNMRNRMTKAGASCGAISTDVKLADKHMPSPMPAKFSRVITARKMR